jgi:hypothetical protein
MFGMMGMEPGWNEQLDDDGDGSSPMNDFIEQDDIVEVATRELIPVLRSTTKYDQLAHLRVLGEMMTDSRTLYLLLVTDVDASKIMSNVKVDRWHTVEYDVESRFYNDNAIVVSELHIRRVVLKQNGRFCVRCKDYNRDMRLPKNEIYTCQACVLNPWR